MTTGRMTFGRVIAEARKKLGLSQKDLAAQVEKEDRRTISAQYLNDIEHDRRNPPSDFILEQLATILKINKDYLYYLAGQLPSDLRSDPSEQKKVEAAFKAFRRTLKE